MDPINRLNRLLETLRQQIADSPRRAGSSSTPPGRQTSQNPLAVRPSLPELRLRIQERLRAVDAASPERKRQARRIFLESVLAWEFGEALMLDEQYSHMLDSLQAAFDADPKLTEQFSALLSDLSHS